MRALWIPILVTVLGTAGCASSPKRLPITGKGEAAHVPIAAERTFAVGREVLRAQLVSTLDELGYPRKTERREPGLIETDWVIIESRRALLGLGESVDDTDGTLSSLVVFPRTKGVRSISTEARDRTEPGAAYSTELDLDDVGVWTKCRHRFELVVSPVGPESTLVRLTPTIECWEKVERKTWTPCASRGVLEATLLDTLEARLRARPTTP
jgi:hypothetical protein